MPTTRINIVEQLYINLYITIRGWWIEPDCNIPSGESFIRQALYGQRYFKEKFGVTAEIQI